MRLGITIPLEGFSNRRILDLARHAESLGYTDAWSMEGFGNDAFSPLAAAAERPFRQQFILAPIWPGRVSRAGAG